MNTTRVQMALASKLLGLKPEATDTQRLMAAAVGELAVRDLINQCLKCIEQFGPGVLLVMADEGGYARWIDPDEIAANLKIAEREDDTPMIRLQRRLLEGIEHFSSQGNVHVWITGMGQHRLYELCVDTAGDAARDKILRTRL